MAHTDQGLQLCCSNSTPAKSLKFYYRAPNTDPKQKDPIILVFEGPLQEERLAWQVLSLVESFQELGGTPDMHPNSP